MRKRDKQIVDALEQFRALSRDQIAELFFSRLKNPITNANYVLKRLRRDGYVEVNMHSQPYVYFPSPSPIKKDGKKVGNYLSIADFYIELRKHGTPREFIVEPRYSDTKVRPDAFMIYKDAPFWIEIQDSVYSHNVMAQKMDLYEQFYASGAYANLPWQPKGKAVFPRIVIISKNGYDVSSPNFRIIQARSASDFAKLVQPKQPSPAPVQQRIVNNGGIKFNLR